MKTIRTIKQVKSWLNDGENNTLFGAHLVSLDRPGEDCKTFRADIHLLEIAFEVFAQLEKNGHDLDDDSIQLGSFSKAYYQVKVREHEEYK